MSIFNKTVITKRIKRSKFDLSHSNLLTMNMGLLVPFFCKEVLPNDTFSISAKAFLRFAPMLKPIFSNINVAIHFWFCPNRILWKNWNDFLTGNNTEAVQPYLQFSNGISRGSLADYLGLPANTLKFNETSGEFEEQININPDLKVSALPFRAYNLIWNEFYRDQELQDKQSISLDDGLDETTNLNLLSRAWKKDYFTSARPQAQYGDGVTIPLGEKAPIIFGEKLSNDTALHSPIANDTTGKQVINSVRGDTVSSSYLGTIDGSGATVGGISNDSKYKLDADLSSASAIDIYKLRLASQMQKFLEMTSRAGNRVKEYLKAHFGVNTSDERLQLPEFLGGSVDKAVFSEVLQTSESSQNSPQGNMSGHGLAYNSGIQVKKKFFEDHGWIIGLINVQPTPAYCQGVDKQWTRETRFDYGLPAFQNIGEQAILQKELFGGSEEPDKVFGYAPRYSEYKSYNNEVHGDFKGVKDMWHTARIFENEPQLNGDFVKCQPTSRIFASDSDEYQKLNVKIDMNIAAKRPFQYFSNPGITGF